MPSTKAALTGTVRLACAAALAVAVAAPTSPALAASAPAAAKLRAALLTAKDLPVGFALDPDSSSDGATGGDYSDAQGVSASCAAKLKALDSPAYSGGTDATRDYTAGSNGPWLNEDLQGFASATAAQRALRGPIAIFAACPSFRFTDPDMGVVSMRVTKLSWRRQGSETAAMRIRITAAGVTIVMDAVVVRRGRVLVSVDAMSTSGRAPSSAKLQTLLTAALAKFDRSGVK